MKIKLNTYKITTLDKYGDDWDNFYNAKNKKDAVKLHSNGICGNQKILKIKKIKSNLSNSLNQLKKIAQDFGY